MPSSASYTLTPELEALGGVNSLVGTLTSRTLMFPELEALFNAKQDEPSRTYRELVVDENVCGKQSHTTRLRTFRHLRELFSLDESTPLFSIWLPLWEVAEEERPLLSLLLAAAREPLIRVTSNAVLKVSPGVGVASKDFEEALENGIPGHYSAEVRARIGRNAGSTWTQSGHLKGRYNKVRTKAVSGPASTAFALFLSHNSGDRGLSLMESFWVQLLDATPVQVDQFAFTAASRGWMEYRRIGDVIDISFNRWETLLTKQTT